MFQCDQKKLYQELDGVTTESEIRPDAQESCGFWSSIWEIPAERNRDVEWLDDVKGELCQYTAKEDVMLPVADVKKQLKNVLN